MATTTPQFGWVVPTSTDLVKDGAVAIETLGDSIDASMADLKGGTTGQILSKTTGTNMDFTWVDPVVGAPIVAGKNKIINGSFLINQRAYVSAANLASGSYGFDRWKSNFTNTTLTFTSSPQGQTLTINSGGGLQQIIERANVPAATYTLSWTGTATARVYNFGGTPPSYAASPITVSLDGSANVVIEFTASGATKTVGLVQFETGSTASDFSLAAGNLASELAACQRYFQKFNPEAANDKPLGVGSYFSTTSFYLTMFFSTQMRIAPTATINNPTNFNVFTNSGLTAATAVSQDSTSPNATNINLTTSASTVGRGGFVMSGNVNASIDFSSEL